MSDNIKVIKKVESKNIDCTGCCFFKKHVGCCIKRDYFSKNPNSFFHCTYMNTNSKYLLQDFDSCQKPFKDAVAFKKVYNDEHSCDGCVFYNNRCGCILKSEGDSEPFKCGDSYKFETVDLSKEVVE